MQTANSRAARRHEPMEWRSSGNALAALFARLTPKARELYGEADYWLCARWSPPQERPIAVFVIDRAGHSSLIKPTKKAGFFSGRIGCLGTRALSVPHIS